MSGQLEWWIMFMSGVLMSYGLLRLFGWVPVVLLLGVVSVNGQYVVIHNDTGASFSYGTEGDPVTAGEYQTTYSWDGYTLDYNGNDLDPGATDVQPMLAAGVAPTGAFQNPTKSGTIMFFGSTDLGGTVGTKNTDIIPQAFPGAGMTNHLHWYQGTDGAFYWAPHGPGGGGTLVDTNAPWVPSGNTNNNFTLMTSNYFNGITYDFGTQYVSSRDAFSYSNLIAGSKALGQMLASTGTNDFNSESGMWTNLMGSSDAGSQTTFNPWLFTYGSEVMSNSTINMDPHQWRYWTAGTTWCKTAWTWVIVISFVFIVKDWIVESIDMGFLVPPEKSLSSVGGFIQGLLTATTFSAILLAIPLALEPYVLHYTGLSPSTSFIGLFTEDGSDWQLYARYGWSFFNEFFPADVFISGCLYLATLKYVVLRGVKAIQYTIIRLTTCIAFLCVASCCYGYNTIQFTDYGQTVNAQILGTGVSGTTYQAPYASVTVGSFGCAFGVGTVEVPDGTVRWSMYDNLGNARSGTLTSCTNKFISMDIYNGSAVIVRDGDTKQEVDGVQAFIEGVGMIVPMFVLGGLYRFRRAASSGFQSVNM